MQIHLYQNCLSGYFGYCTERGDYMGYRMYVETEDKKELFCGGKLFGYVQNHLCGSYFFLKLNCYSTNQLDQLRILNYGTECSFRFPGKMIKKFLKFYVEDCKKLEPELWSSFENFDECIKNLNDDTTYILTWN